MRERERKKIVLVKDNKALKKKKKVIEFRQDQAASMLKVLRPNFCGPRVMRSWC